MIIFVCGFVMIFLIKFWVYNEEEMNIFKIDFDKVIEKLL